MNPLCPTCFEPLGDMTTEVRGSERTVGYKCFESDCPAQSWSYDKWDEQIRWEVTKFSSKGEALSIWYYTDEFSARHKVLHESPDESEVSEKQNGNYVAESDTKMVVAKPFYLHP